MSARNGDKARFGKQRKRKMAHRARTEELRAGLRASVTQEIAPAHDAPAGSEHHTPLATAAETIGSVLGNIAAKVKGVKAHEPEPTHAD